MTLISPTRVPKMPLVCKSIETSRLSPNNNSTYPSTACGMPVRRSMGYEANSHLASGDYACAGSTGRRLPLS
jgi:hypothetical protein